jgi:hypothetical protein
VLAQCWGSVTVAASLISTLAVERSLSVGDGLAAEIEANRLFLAASIACSLMELVGRLAYLRNRMTKLREEEPVLNDNVEAISVHLSGPYPPTYPRDGYVP